MATWENRRRTSRERRSQIIRALTTGFDMWDAASPARRLRDLIDTGERRWLVVSGDVDGLISAMMLSSVTRWEVGALLVPEGVRLHPRFRSASELFGRSDLFGVDVLSPGYDSVSNHATHWGRKRLGSSKDAEAAGVHYDRELDALLSTRIVVNPSVWAGIQGATGSDANPKHLGYRYPLGTAHVVLALLEVIGAPIRLFDREYLPWMIANCDGGLDSIKKYSWNAPMWWSSLAAAVGPGSLSEQIWRLASEQRPLEFLAADRRLRYEERDTQVAECLDESWNLASTAPEVFSRVQGWVGDLTGWPDPFHGGSAELHTWPVEALASGEINVSKLPPGGAEELAALFEQALASVHLSIVQFREGTRLAWRSVA